MAYDGRHTYIQAGMHRNGEYKHVSGRLSQFGNHGDKTAAGWQGTEAAAAHTAATAAH